MEKRYSNTLKKEGRAFRNIGNTYSSQLFNQPCFSSFIYNTPANKIGSIILVQDGASLLTICCHQGSFGLLLAVPFLPKLARPENNTLIYFIVRRIGKQGDRFESANLSSVYISP